MPSKNRNWKKQNRAYSINRPGEPFSARFVSIANHSDLGDQPLSVSVYGSFSDDILIWIDKQPTLDDLVGQEIESRYYELKMIHQSIKPAKEPKKAKELKSERTIIIRARRARFEKNRDQLMLAMLHNGMPYICAHPKCGEMTSLHVDHKIPLSKGGSDELSNLQFLCANHNYQKGSKF